jgi:arabinan endo-1,5-alpha-L-arabinosidase
MIGRSTSPQGPFLDKQGKSMLEGGGSELLVTEFPMIGPGGAFIFSDTDHELIVYHYYDGLNNGSPRLAINYLGWTEDGWPYVY